MLLCYVIDSGLSTSLLLLATLIFMFYITLHYTDKQSGETIPETDKTPENKEDMFWGQEVNHCCALVTALPCYGALEIVVFD